MKISLKKENNITNVDECVDNYLKENNLKKDDILLNIQEDDILIINKQELIEYVKNYIKTITDSLNLDVEIRSTFNGEIMNINIESNNNGILIGREARMLNAIQVLLKQAIKSQTGMNIKVILDIGNYKQQKIEQIKLLAHSVAKEVIDTKMTVKLDSMNSYERRIIHNIISEYDNLITKSEGEEPNRYVVVKYKD